MSERAKVSSRLLGRLFTVGSLTVVVKLAATAKELLVARRFGTGDDLDAFLMAFLVPSFALNVLAGGFQLAFMPTYIRVREQEGPAAAERLFAEVTTGLVVLFVAVAGLLAALAPVYVPLLCPSFAPEKLALTRRLVVEMLPLVVLSGLSFSLAGVLNAAHRYALAAAAPLATPLLLGILLVGLGPRATAGHLALGVVIGLGVELVCLAVGVRRLGVSLRPRRPRPDPAAREVARQYLPMVASCVLMSGTQLVDQSMAAWLGPGSVSALGYGAKVVGMFVAVGTGALSTVFLPHFSDQVAQQDWVGLRRGLRRALALVLAAAIAVTATLVALSRPLVVLLFQRGAFSAADADLVARVQALYALQIPFATAGMILVRLISSLRGHRIILWAAGLNLAVDISMNLVLMRVLGVAGIALSTSVVYLGSFSFLWFWARRLLSAPDGGPARA